MIRLNQKGTHLLTGITLLPFPSTKDNHGGNLKILQPPLSVACMCKEKYSIIAQSFSLARKVHRVHNSYRGSYWLKIDVWYWYHDPITCTCHAVTSQIRPSGTLQHPERRRLSPGFLKSVTVGLVNTRKHSEIIESHPLKFVKIYRSHVHRRRSHHYSRPPCWFMVYGVRQEPLLNLTLLLEL